MIFCEHFKGLEKWSKRSEEKEDRSKTMPDNDGKRMHFSMTDAHYGETPLELKQFYLA